MIARRARRAGARVCLPLLALAAGCATADLDVVRPVPLEVRRVTLTVHDETPGDMSAEDLDELAGIVTDELEDADIAVLPAGTRDATPLVGRVTRYDPGIRALRYVSGYGLGTATMVSTWATLDARGREISSCRIEGSLSMGTFGGSVREIQEETGRALTRFLLGGVH